MNELFLIRAKEFLLFFVTFSTNSWLLRKQDKISKIFMNETLEGGFHVH